MKEKITFKGIVEILKKAINGFSQHRVTKLGGSLAYATIFSLGPLFILIIYLFGMFLGKDAIEGKIYVQLSDFVGDHAATQLQEIIKNASIDASGNMAGLIGAITLLIGATAIFAEIQDSINLIWDLKPKPKRGWLKFLQNRFLSFSVITSLGFLLLVSLAITTLIDGVGNRLEQHFPEITITVFYILNLCMTLVIVTSIFAVIFKVLPDAVIKWRDVFTGALITAILFMVGKLAISFYISKTDIGSIYGAAGSLVIILLWVYYSSLILFFGAEFTKAYAMKYGSKIFPNDYAVTIKTIETETRAEALENEE